MDGSSHHGDRPRWVADPARYEEHAPYNVSYAGPVLDMLDPRPGERILDLGCGDGRLSLRLAEQGCEVVGVDASPQMVAAARDRGLEAVVADARDLPAELGPFDAVFSNAALHWIPEADAVLASVQRMLPAGGRFVAEFGGHANVAALRAAARTVMQLPAFFFPSDGHYAARLEACGFTVLRCELVPRLTLLPTGLRGWARTFLADVTDEQIAAMERLLAPILRDEAGDWWAGYVRLRVHATL